MTTPEQELELVALAKQLCGVFNKIPNMDEAWPLLPPLHQERWLATAQEAQDTIHCRSCDGYLCAQR